MIGEMFDHAFKTKVEQPCNELAQQLDKQKLTERAEGIRTTGGPVILGDQRRWQPKLLARL